MSSQYGTTADSVESDYRSYRLRKVVFIITFLVGCIVVAGISLTINGRDIGFIDCYRYIFDHILGREYEFRSVEWLDDYVLWNNYMPRIMIAVISGCGLAIAGVIMQSVFSNPLADPYTTGVSDGATLGASVAIVTGMAYAGIAGSMGIVVNAFIGALIPAVIIIFISGVVRLSPASLILIGVALSGVFSGLQTLILYSADHEEVTEALRWGIGSFNQIAWDDCMIPLVVTVVGAVVSVFLYRQLNLLTLGENSAKSLGLNVEQFKSLCMVLVAIMVASIICYVGIIGFVGLIAPHIVRMILGGDNKYVIPASMLVGTFFLLLADLLARVVIFPDELRVGLIMSVIGAPIFLYMIVKRKKGYGEVF